MSNSEVSENTVGVGHYTLNGKLFNPGKAHGDVQIQRVVSD